MRYTAVILFISAFFTPNAFATVAPMSSPKSPRSPKSPELYGYQPLTIDGLVDAAASRVLRMIRDVEHGSLPQSEFDEMVSESPVLKTGLTQLCSSPTSLRSDGIRSALDRQAGRALGYLTEEAIDSLKRAAKEDRFKFFMQEMASSRTSSRGASPVSPTANSTASPLSSI
jgi:hypothetical protein